MKTTRAELPDGQWAELRQSPTHAQYRAIISAMEDAASGRGSMVDWASTVGRQLCVAWHVLDDEGVAIELDDDGWDEAPADIVLAVCDEAQAVYRQWETARRPLVKKRQARLQALPESNEMSESSSDAT